MTAKKFLKERLKQLKNRRTGIEIYLQNINKELIAGFRQYKKEDLIKVHLDIDETEAALSGIQDWETKNKLLKELKCQKS